MSRVGVSAAGWGSIARSRDPGLHGRRPVLVPPRLGLLAADRLHDVLERPDAPQVWETVAYPVPFAQYSPAIIDPPAGAEVVSAVDGPITLGDFGLPVAAK